MPTPSFRLGAPHHLSQFDAVIYPILASAPAPRSRLVMFPAAPDAVEAKDTGQIDAVDLTNKGPQPVYIRAGTLFEGVGTQSRTNVRDVVVMPGASVKVEARCVHMSHHIQPGAAFRSRGETAPLEVERNLVKGQRDTWRGVEEYVEKASTSRSRSLGARSDELIRAKSGAWAAEQDAGAALLAKIPRVPGQVGVLTIVRGKLAGFEAFGDEASWQAYAEDVLRKHVDAILTSSAEPASDAAQEALRLLNGLVEQRGDGAFAEGVAFVQHEGQLVRIARYA